MTQESKIVKITPIDEVFSITWNLHKRCNNDCMYCGEFLHDSISPVKSLEELQSQWKQIFEKTRHIGRKYKVSFTGGEPVINKNFMPLVGWLQQNYSPYLDSLRLTSNGTASKEYYLKIFKDLVSLTLSTHTESFNIDRFIDTAVACNQYAKQHPEKSFMVNIMEEYWALDIIKQLIDRLQQHQIRFSINKINYHRTGNRSYPIFIVNKQPVPRTDLAYSDQIIEQVHQQIQEHANLKNIPKDEFYNIEIEYEDGSTIKTYATRLNFLGLNKFKGWSCHAGLYRLNIASTGEVFDGECYNQSLGHLSDASFQLRTEPGVCKLKKCTGNPDDIMVLKTSVNLQGSTKIT
jgi:organic radical activating enzyme